MPNPRVTAEIIWDYIVAMLKAEAGLGLTPAQTALLVGTTPQNRLAGLKYVGYSLHLWTDKVPSIGVQLRDSPEQAEGAQRHLVTAVFDMLMGCQSTEASAAQRFGPNTKPNAEDAQLQLKALVNDGAGNGIREVLMDPQYRFLGTTDGVVNASSSKIKIIEYEQEVTEGKNAQVWAYALVTFIAEQYNVPIT